MQRTHCKTSVQKLFDVIATCAYYTLRAGRGSAVHADHMTMAIIVGWIRAGQRRGHTEGSLITNG